MSPSIREQILTTVESVLLAGTTKVATRNIYRSRVDAFSRSEHPWVLIEPAVDDQSEEISLCKLDWNFRFRITIGVRDLVPDRYADDIVQDIHKKLYASWKTGALNPLLIDLQPVQYLPQFQEGDQPIALIHLVFMVKYRTSLDDLAV